MMEITMTKDFGTSIKLLYETALEVHEKAYGPMAEQRFWLKNLGKFHSAFIKSKKDDSFHPMFLKFYQLHQKELAKPILVEEKGGYRVKDSWFKAEGEKKKEPWQTPSRRRCIGHVVYVDDDPKIASVCVPITELYRCALKVRKEKGEKSESVISLPFRVLYYFYSIIYSVLSKDLFPEKEGVIAENCETLKVEVEAVAPGERSSGSGMGGLSSMLGQIMKSAGMEGDFDEGKIGEVLGGALGGKGLDDIGKVVGSVFKAVKGGEGDEPKDVGDILGRVGKVLQSDEIKGAITNTAVAAHVQDQVNSDSVTDLVVPMGDPTLQE